MSFTQHNLYPLTLGGTTLGTLDELKVDPKIGLESQRAAGSLFPIDAFVSSIESQFTFKTPDLTAILSTLAISLTAGKALGTASPSLFQFRKRSSGGWASGSNHFNIKSFNGFVYVERIEASQGEKKKAIATLHHVPLADGSGNYLLPQGGQALTGSVGMTDYGFALGPLYIDVSGSPVQVDGNSKFSFESGIKFDPRPAAGELFARQGTTTAVMPKISFSVVEILDLLTWGLSSTAITNVTQYLIAIDSHGNRIAGAETDHMSIAFPTAKLMPASVTGGADNVDAGLDYEAHCIGETVTVSLGVALP